ncbi:unnamed protein product [Cylicostephanus goldi]|uniref:Uncharacterized protein n=1 Tax=Cylicostephanus goldi TaxID=71465 RepID=A0A3P7LZX5_CYLGO|nr:unnamed protein product [Cylicostephanus goldi]
MYRESRCQYSGAGAWVKKSAGDRYPTNSELTISSRTTCVSVCQSLLLRPHKQEFLSNLVTGDESWVLYKNEKMSGQHTGYLAQSSHPRSRNQRHTE